MTDYEIQALLTTHNFILEEQALKIEKEREKRSQKPEALLSRK